MTTKSLAEEMTTCRMLCEQYGQEELLLERDEISGNLERYPEHGKQILEELYAWVGRVYDWWKEFSETPDEESVAARNGLASMEDE